MKPPGECCLHMIKLNIKNRLTDWLAITLSCGGCARIWVWDCQTQSENPFVIGDMEWIEDEEV